MPLCTANSKKDRHLKFYRFPSGKSKEKQELRKKWINLISRKGLNNPTESQKVCSQHFVGGMKTYINNLPLIVPKATRPSITKETTTVPSRNRDVELVNKATAAYEKTNANLSKQVPKNKTAEEEIVARKERIEKLEIELTNKVEKLSAECEKLQQNFEREQKIKFHVDNIKDDNQRFHFYTGFTDYQIFKIVFESFGPAVHKLIYYDSNTNAQKVNENGSKRGPNRSLSAEREFFLVLVRLRCGLLKEDLSYRAGISTSHFSRIFITWIDFLQSRFRSLPIWASKETVKETMPKCFEDTYPTTRVIIDATEVFIEMPSSMRSQNETYSNYKHHNTAKGLVGIAPSGAVTFVSDSYAGRCSDNAITRDCGILNLLEKEDSVMADKGFSIADDLPPDTYLNIPSFFRNSACLNIHEETETRRIASVRVHVERSIRRIKTFRILRTIFPISMAADLNKMWVVCAYLTNFLPPLIAESD